MKLPIHFHRVRAEAPKEGDHAAGQKKPGSRKKKRPVKRAIAAVVLVAVVGGVALRVAFPGGEAAAASFTEEQAATRDIQNVLTATGTLAPLNQYDVTTLVKGEVLTCTFEEGDVVEKDQLLYTIDSSDVQNNIEKSRISLEQSRLSYQQQLDSVGDLSVTADRAGMITEVNVQEGDNVQSGTKIATLRDSSVMKLCVPFNSSDAAGFSIGQAATVTLDGSFETLGGTVTEIDGADSVLDGYQMVRNVTITVQNPGALSPSAAGSATIGGVACNSGANFTYNEERSITAETSGKVVSVVSSGAAVRSGDVVARLSSDSLQTQVQNSQLSLQNAELSLQNTIDSLDDYNIRAPIAGTVVTRNTKAGDSIDSSNGVSALAVIYDMSALTFDIALDELDVNQVKVGQTVNITVDALDGKEFTGSITKVSVAGTTTNGATTYPVTVQIDNPPEELYPGMNVNASIIVEEADGVLAIPTAAVQRGDMVYVKGASGTDDAGAQDGGEGPRATGAPEGYHAVKVETGISDDSYIEVTSGLTEGDTVYVPQVTGMKDGSSVQNAMQMGGDMGGPPSGGGMGGGMGGPPSGGGMP